MAEEIVASKQKAENSYGQNGYQGASSLTPGEKKSPIANVSPPQVAAPGLLAADTLGARVKMDGDKAAAYSAHDGMSNRSTNRETVPASNNRGAKPLGKRG